MDFESRIIVLLHIQRIFWGNDLARRNSILKLDTMPRFNRPSKLCSKHTEIQVFQREHSIKSGIDVKIQPSYFKIKDIDCISVVPSFDTNFNQTAR